MKKVLFILFLFVGSSYAGLYPVITSVTTKNTFVSNEPAHQWFFTQEILDIGPAADQLFPTSIYYKLGLGIRYRGVSEDYVSFQNGYETSNNNGRETIGEVAIRAYNQRGKDTTSYFMYDDKLVSDSEVCLGYIAGRYITSGTLGVDWEGSIRPGGCMIAPPATDWCKLTTPEILLDHGNLTLQNAEGDTARANVNVQCTTETAVTFNLVTDDKYVYLDEGKSEISVDDKPLNTPINLPSGNSSVTVKDYLTGVTKEGYHTGSSVLVMMPY
ncbi:hypothetical protein SNQ26_001330 [Cronobacter malonaticus]|uniref:hypothetical protein n=1 Tax=Cronobacter malonaticus TaxID=413503 RepID=UPI0012D3029A|nr:hypothetical protein [Cronobacter malonaticus]ELY6228171.1 hypothetical protein [Cronobacter malonaticus]MDI6469306.1 hypothetical protein [Cronobacter malonaticus]MDK1177830.1 hypothetical protein [Cronobacter malonaticus]MDK1688730.1 hypothetical protein [Cronobacter malonaticus]HAU5448749.1 hypothetical protein [Cronobacter malonaticus]